MGVGEGGLDLLDHAAELLERPHRGPHERGDLGIDAESSEIGTEGDAQASQIARELADVIVGRRLQGRPVAIVGAGHDRQHQGRVGHRTGHRAVVR